MLAGPEECAEVGGNGVLLPDLRLERQYWGMGKQELPEYEYDSEKHM